MRRSSLVKSINSEEFHEFIMDIKIISDPVQKYYQKAEEILKLLKPILETIVNSEVASDEVLNKDFQELGQSVDELREIFENWQPLSSKVHFLLKASHQQLPDELSSSSLENCIQKIKLSGYVQTSSIIKEAISGQEEGVGPSSEILVKIADKPVLEVQSGDFD
ncbi:hypothetical protein NC653_013882 [Populus alba x Populus x berolinensis]|uniref:PUB2-4-like N-terminal domain-containing protein n=1 Tax=Populus alba x Populus x berolinensis TaxID=444605 RepID=A0AAD6QVP0_9ROSI|nr:hypothetical protein NC653_013882 [Populus alba x Populus x berolinensis]